LATAETDEPPASTIHQRNGLGTLPIREGLSIADKYKVNTYLEASPEGFNLYLRHGWPEVDEMRLDLKPYGWRENSIDKCMSRKSGAT
jgi:hypothetical protein